MTVRPTTVYGSVQNEAILSLVDCVPVFFDNGSVGIIVSIIADAEVNNPAASTTTTEAK